MTRPLVLIALWLASGALVNADAPVASGLTSCIPGGGGRLVMELSGQFDASIDWGNEGTVCEGGPRPEGDALRLMFKREDEGLLVLIAITGLERGVTGTGLLANLTMVREGRGEFYGTLGADSCVVDVTENVPEPSAANAYRVSGEGRCVAPIEAIAREGEVRVATPFRFTGVVYWHEEEDQT